MCHCLEFQYVCLVPNCFNHEQLVPELKTCCLFFEHALVLFQHQTWVPAAAIRIDVPRLLQARNKPSR